MKINCSICSEVIEFDPKDPSTYIQKATSTNRMLGDLVTYRIKHHLDSLICHVNVIVLDANFDYRAHKDAYVEKTELLYDEMLWQEFILIVPIEIKHFITMMDRATIYQIQSELPNKEMEPLEWYEYFKSLYYKNPKNIMLRFIFAKWSFIIGKPIEFEQAPTANDWEYPMYMRLQCRASVDAKCYDELDKFDYSSNIYMELEFASAKAEIAYRCSLYDKLEELYETYTAIWGEKTLYPYSVSYNYIKSCYGLGLLVRGKINQSQEIFKSVFNLSQIIGARDLMVFSGMYYGASLRIGGKLDEAESVYHLVLDLIRSLGDERNEFIVSEALAIIQSQRGQLEDALEIYQKLSVSPFIEKEPSMALVVYNNSAEVLMGLQKYQEALDTLKKSLEHDIVIRIALPIYMSSLSCIRKLSSNNEFEALVAKINEKGLGDDDYSEVVRININATRAELENKWDRAINYLLDMLKLANKNEYMETVANTEMRLAEAYYFNYVEKKSPEDINNCYKHLDLLRSIALAGGFQTALYSITKLKGMIAHSVGYNERAITLLEQAEDIAHRHQLTHLEDEVSQLLNNMRENSLQIDGAQLFRDFRLQSISSGAKQKSKVRAIMIFSNDLGWSLSLTENGPQKEDTIKYLRVVRMMWRYSWDFISSRGISILRDQTGSNSIGSLVIEQSNSYFILALCNDESYKLRMDLQDILRRLESFELSYVTEERREFLKSTIAKVMNLDTEIFFD